MYHAHFRGTHYEAGFRWGSLLLKHKNIILEHIPFEITGERMAYGAACVPVYERHYPEILEEIQGLADGQQARERHSRPLAEPRHAVFDGDHGRCNR